jgi:hypothetical protein
MHNSLARSLSVLASLIFTAVVSKAQVSCTCVKALNAAGTTAAGEGDNHIVFKTLTGEDVKWQDPLPGAPSTTAGVTLGYSDITAIKVAGVPVPVPVPTSDFIGNITDYLSEGRDGLCPPAGFSCPVVSGCWHRISYTLDATGSDFKGPIEWTTSNSGGVQETDTLDKSNPNHSTLDINLYCSAPCQGGFGGSGSAQVTQDCGYMTPTRVFQKLAISCVASCD